MKTKHTLIISAIFALGAQVSMAADSSVGCELEKAKAEVVAQIEGAPKVVASVGATVIDTKNVVVGVSQSLSGYYKAADIRRAAEAKCAAIAAQTEFDKYALFAEASVRAAGASAQLKVLSRAIDFANESLKKLDAQLSAQVITINEHTTARLALVKLQQKNAEALKELATPQGGFTSDKLGKLAGVARESEAQAAGLSAKAQAQSGWDLSVTAGARQPTSGDTRTQTFVAVSANWSFGYNGAKDAAARVQTLTDQYLQSSLGGIDQQILRQKEKTLKLMDAERAVIDATEAQISQLRQVRSSVEGINSTLAQNSVRNLTIEMMGLQADLEGANARLVKLQELATAL